jgi:hypothetical protein
MRLTARATCATSCCGRWPRGWRGIALAVTQLDMPPVIVCATRPGTARSLDNRLSQRFEAYLTYRGYRSECREGRAVDVPNEHSFWHT